MGFLEEYKVLEICTVVLSEIYFIKLKSKSMIEILTKISLHLLIAMLLKTFIVLILKYIGTQATDGRYCIYEIERKCTKIPNVKVRGVRSPCLLQKSHIHMWLFFNNFYRFSGS